MVQWSTPDLSVLSGCNFRVVNVWDSGPMVHRSEQLSLQSKLFFMLWSSGPLLIWVFCLDAMLELWMCETVVLWSTNLSNLFCKENYFSCHGPMQWSTPDLSICLDALLELWTCDTMVLWSTYQKKNISLTLFQLPTPKASVCLDSLLVFWMGGAVVLWSTNVGQPSWKTQAVMFTPLVTEVFINIPWFPCQVTCGLDVRSKGFGFKGKINLLASFVMVGMTDFPRFQTMIFKT